MHIGAPIDRGRGKEGGRTPDNFGRVFFCGHMRTLSAVCNGTGGVTARSTVYLPMCKCRDKKIISCLKCESVIFSCFSKHAACWSVDRYTNSVSATPKLNLNIRNYRYDFKNPLCTSRFKTGGKDCISDLLLSLSLLEHGSRLGI